MITDAILCSDIHLQERQPPARKDDFWQTQWRKISFIKELQKKYKCPVWHAGDLFDHWKPSPLLLSTAITFLPKKFHTIYGQHDLPQHNFDLRGKSGMRTLEVAGMLEVLEECHWGFTPQEGSFEVECDGIDVTSMADTEPTYIGDYHRKVLLWHKLVWKGKKPYPYSKDPSAKRILKKYPQFDLILTGDNHKPFVEEYEGRLLVNPGSLFRTTADQVDHKPRVYLWYADSNKVEPVYIPIEKDAVSREHIEKQNERNDRIDAFISQLNNKWKAGLNFEENLTLFTDKNKTSKAVCNIIFKAIDNDKNN